MPRGDSSGPGNQGRGGRSDQGFGKGRGMGRRGQGAGPAGECVCPGCGAKVPHQAGIPCSSLSCPKCGRQMLRF